VVATATLFGGGIWFNRQLSRELVQTDQARSELQIALVRQVAERLDSDLRQLAGVPRTLAVMLAERSDWTETQLDACLRELIDRDPRLFGMCIAFEPGQFDPQREDYARYICRAPTGPEGSPAGPNSRVDAAAIVQSQVVFKYLHPPEYRPYREWDWYRLPKQDGQPHWSEPYVDTGGGEIPMVTYSAPFERNDRFVGVVTADLSLAYFRQLKGWPNELELAKGDYGFVISRAGTFISHQNSEYQMRRNIADFATPDSDLGFQTLLELIRRQEPGRVHGIDFWTGDPRTFLVAPVPSSGWSFVAVIPEPAERGNFSVP
ncbi:MAG: hypothetical protein HY000_06650, partial [Planctomycetes bacterium]|nr:hypothetical protein [Planctomycetota bacterium]